MRLAVDRDALAEICRHHRIRHLSLFGSVLKGTAGPDSDIDLLVEFEPGARPACRPVDLRTVEELSQFFRDEVVRSAEVQFAA